MHVAVHLNKGGIRRWHLHLLECLTALPGCQVSVILEDGVVHLPGGLETLFLLEAVLHGSKGPAAVERVEPAELAGFDRASGEPVDLELDLWGGADPVGGRVWTLAYNSVPGDQGLVAAVLEGSSVVAELLENGQPVAGGRLGTELGGVALATFQDVALRTVTLIVAAVRQGGPPPPPVLPGERAGRPTGSRRIVRSLHARAVTALAGNIARRLYQLCYRTPHWRVGWRRLEGDDLLDLRHHPSSGWADLPDDGRRFYADPFPIAKDGRVTLFVEDFIHAIGKGIVSAVEFGPSGPLGRPVPVLEEDIHLSYPFVFERDGEMWMIPETHQRDTVELYRAESFPSGWVREAVLVSGVTASDATLVEHDGVWWMFATVRDGGGAFSDALHLWHAPDFRGPWTAHCANPVLIDIASARPAGRMVSRRGALLRPVQDCRDGYGAALGLARVTRLDRYGYSQAVETILGPGPLWPGRRLHTLNSAGGFEFIDGSAMAPRWR